MFALNRKLFKAYVLKESLDWLWTYRYEGAMLSYLERWIDQLRWQRLRPFEKLAAMLLKHLDGILNYCRTKVPLGMVEAIVHRVSMRPRSIVAVRFFLHSDSSLRTGAGFMTAAMPVVLIWTSIPPTTLSRYLLAGHRLRPSARVHLSPGAAPA